MKKILVVYGTRPEAIKLAPLIKNLENHNSSFRTEICVTGQHREMLYQVNDFFGIKPDYDLELMKPGQSLSNITVACIKGLERILIEEEVDLVIVQGDTTTAMAGALAAFYQKKDIAHIEAGLRSGDLYSPFPEEANRKIISQLARYHFAPTNKAVSNLYSEGIKENVFMVGNTVIDALRYGMEIIKKQDEEKYYLKYSFMKKGRKLILVTGHRRESFGEGFEIICDSIREIARCNPEIDILYPVHLNPNVREPVNRILSEIENIYLVKPMEYPELIWAMSKSLFIITDSGGIQEEGPALGKPVLVMRNVTERIEGIEAGTALLVGTKKENIVKYSNELILEGSLYYKMSQAINPYGDGHSSERIIDILKIK